MRNHPTAAEEVGRLRDAELAAERRYDEAVHDCDPSAARVAAAEWKDAADALSQYIAKHPYPYQDSPPSWQGVYMSYRFCGYGPMRSAWRACCSWCGKQSVTARLRVKKRMAV
jgi:hypothetical protein